MTPQDETDEEYLDDPIRFTDSEFKVIENAQANGTDKIIDLTGSEDISFATESVFSTAFTTRPSVNLNLNSVSLPHDIKLSTFPNLRIKLVDYAKYPWFYRNIKCTGSATYIYSKANTIPKNTSDQHQLTVHQVTMHEILKHKIRPVGTPYNALKGKPSSDKKGNTIIIGDKNRKVNGTTEESIFGQIDFKKNKGLVGMKITQMNDFFSKSLKDRIDAVPEVSQNAKAKTKSSNLDSWLTTVKKNVLAECEPVKSHFLQDGNKNLTVSGTKCEENIIEKQVSIKSKPKTPSISEIKHSLNIMSKPATPSQVVHQRNSLDIEIVNLMKTKEFHKGSSGLLTFKSDLRQENKIISPTKVNVVKPCIVSSKESSNNLHKIENCLTDKKNAKNLTKENKLKQGSNLENVLEKVIGIKKKQLKNKNDNSVKRKSNDILLSYDQYLTERKLTNSLNVNMDLQQQCNSLNTSQKSKQSKKNKVFNKDIKNKNKTPNASDVDANVTNSKQSSGSKNKNNQATDKKKLKSDKKKNVSAGRAVNPKNVTLMPNKNMIINSPENYKKNTKTVAQLRRNSQTNELCPTVGNSQLVSYFTDKPESCPKVNTPPMTSSVSIASHLGNTGSPISTLQRVANALSGQNIVSSGLQGNSNVNVHQDGPIINTLEMRPQNYAQSTNQHGIQKMDGMDASGFSIPPNQLQKNPYIIHPSGLNQNSYPNNNSNTSVKATPPITSIAKLGNELREYYNTQMDSLSHTPNNYRHHLPQIGSILRPTPQVPNNNFAPGTIPTPNHVPTNSSNVGPVETSNTFNMINELNTNVAQQYPIQTYVTNRNEQSRYPILRQNLQPTNIGQNNMIPNFPRPYLRMPCAPIYNGMPQNFPPEAQYWRNDNHQAVRFPPPLPPPNIQASSGSKSFEGSTIIGQNIAGPVRKINIVAVPITAFDRPKKQRVPDIKSSNKPNESNNISPNNLSVPNTASTDKPIIPDTKIEKDITPINSKQEMLEELHKSLRSVSPPNSDVIIPTVKPELLPPKNVVDRNDLRRSVAETNNNRPGPLCKKTKLDVSSITDETQKKSPRKGYSQPILPIPPTYEETIDMIISRYKDKYGTCGTS